MGKEQPQNLSFPRNALISIFVLILVFFLVIYSLSWTINSSRINVRTIVPPPDLGRILAKKPDIGASSGHAMPSLADKTMMESYRDLLCRAKREKLFDQVRTVFPDIQGRMNPNTHRKDSKPWRGDPLTQAQIDWMHAHVNLVNDILHFVDTPGTVAPIPGEPFGSRMGLCNTLMQLLIADGWLKLHEGRADGVQSYLAIYLLSEKCVYPDYPYSGGFWELILRNDYIMTSNRLIQEWIEDPIYPKKDVREVLNRLNQIQQKMISPESRRADYQRIVEEDYAFQRQDLIKTLNELPWKSFMFGYDIDSNYDYYWPEIKGCHFQLPRVDRMLPTVIKAMNNKRNAAQYVRTMDHQWEKALAWPTLTWPEIKKMMDTDTQSRQWWGSLPEMFIIRLTAETKLNLNRAALTWMIDPQSAMAASTVNFKKDPENPWRDPFTDQPFKMIKTPTQTLIYSLGQYLEDHQGRFSHDPNGLVIPGNIAIRIPSR
jgi:hypothetical protein